METYSPYVMVPTNLSFNLMVLRRHGLLIILRQQIIFLAALSQVELQGMHIEANYLEYMLYYWLSTT